jgi:hypothetical protein
MRGGEHGANNTSRAFDVLARLWRRRGKRQRRGVGRWWSEALAVSLHYAPGAKRVERGARGCAPLRAGCETSGARRSRLRSITRRVRNEWSETVGNRRFGSISGGVGSGAKPHTRALAGIDCAEGMGYPPFPHTRSGAARYCAEKAPGGALEPTPFPTAPLTGARADHLPYTAQLTGARADHLPHPARLTFAGASCWFRARGRPSRSAEPTARCASRGVMLAA